MRVVYVSVDPGVPVFGSKGCSVHVQEVLRVFVAGGHDVHVVTTRPGGPAPEGLDAVTVHHVELPSGRSGAERERDLVAADATVGELVTSLITGEVLVYERYALFACAAQEAARTAGVPSVLEVNAPLPVEQARHRGLHDVGSAGSRTVRAFAASSRVVAVSSAVGSWVSELAPTAEVVVVPNGVDVERFRPGRSVRGRIVFVGAFRPWHGVDLLVEAVGRLTRPVELVLVGDGPTREASLARAAELGVTVVAPGAVDPADVPGWIADASIAVAPYPAGDGYFSPLKVAEYLACGVATVAGSVGDLARTYLDGVEVLLTEPGDVYELSAALQQLLDDDAVRDDLARAGRAAVLARGTWAGVVERSIEGLRTEVPA